MKVPEFGGAKSKELKTAIINLKDTLEKNFIIKEQKGGGGAKKIIHKRIGSAL